LKRNKINKIKKKNPKTKIQQKSQVNDEQIKEEDKKETNNQEIKIEITEIKSSTENETEKKAEDKKITDEEEDIIEEEEEEDNPDKPLPPYKRTPNLVHEILYLGDQKDAQNKKKLEKRGIKYIINMACAENYFPEDYEYLKLDVSDTPSQDLTQHFKQCFEFIDKGFNEKKSVLVHCQMGLSRSATIVIGYMMKSQGWPLEKAYSHVFEARGFIMPNDGFHYQLLKYEKQLYGKITMEPRGFMSERWQEESELEKKKQQAKDEKKSETPPVKKQRSKTSSASTTVKRKDSCLVM